MLGAKSYLISQTFNAAGRPTLATNSWTGSQHPATLASGVHYNGAGSVTGNVLDFWYGYNAGSSDNGNVMNWNATGQQSSIRTYTYDALNRLGTMADSATGATCKGLSWSYDQWGNRTAQNVTAGTCGSSQLGYNSYNHITNSGFQYDAAGNMTHDASHSYTYDAEDRITQVDGGSTAAFTYGADGRRVSKTAAGSQMNYLYDLSGQVISEFNASSWQSIYLRLNGALFAEYSVSPYITKFIHLDHLGSARLVTNISGGVVDSLDYLPFGEQIAGASATTHKFTGKERDSESGLDNAQARYNSSSLGRFMSPDPAGNDVADPTNPQSWNLYAYVQNNPLIFIDPSGLECVWDDGSYDGPDDPNTGALTLCNKLGGTWVNPQFFADFGLPDWTSSPDAGLAFIAWAQQNGYTLTQGGTGLNGWSLQAPGSVLPPTLDDYVQALELAGEEASYYAGCIAIPGAGLLTGGTALKLGQPIAGSKPFVTPGSSQGTSTASEALRDALPQKLPFRVPTPVGGPGTGTPIRMAATNNLGAAAGRYVPFVGAAVTAYSAYKMNQCLSTKPK